MPGRNTHHCCAPNCKNTYYLNITDTSYRNKRLFKVTADREMIWTESVRKLSKPDFNLMNKNNSFFCEDHFELKCFKNSKKDSLNKNAVPTIFCESNSSSSSVNSLSSNICLKTTQESVKQFVSATLENAEIYKRQTSISEDFSEQPFKKPKYTYSKLASVNTTASTRTVIVDDTMPHEAESNTGCGVLPSMNLGGECNLNKMCIPESRQEIILRTPQPSTSKDRIIVTPISFTPHPASSFEQESSVLQQKGHESSPSVPRLSVVSPSKLFIVTRDPLSKSPTITTVPSHLDEDEHISSSAITLTDSEDDTYLENCTRTERKGIHKIGDSKKVIRNWEIVKKIQQKQKQIKQLQRNSRRLEIKISHLKSSMTYLKDQFQISKNAKFALNAAEQKDNMCVADCNTDQVTCRTCLTVIKKKNFSKISQTCFLTKTIKDVILLLVPEMASTLFDNEWVCKNCSQTLKKCMRFIERCLEIELQNAEKQKALEQSSDGEDWPETEENSNEIEENRVPLINNLEQINLDHNYYSDIEPEDCNNTSSKNTVNVEDNSNLPENDAIALQLLFNSPLPDIVESSIVDDYSTSPKYTLWESLSADTEGTVEYDDKIEDSSEGSQSHNASVLPQKSTTSTSSKDLDSETSKLNSAETDTYTCSTCSEKFSCSLDYKLHLQIHPAFICHHCGKCLTTQDSYKQHIKVHTQKGLKLCELCGKCFKNMGALKGHLTGVHQHDSLHMCHKCPKRFKNKICLKRHFQLVHEKARQHQCQECGKWFCDKETCRSHYRLMHLKMKPYVCQVCGKEFGRKDYLRKHIYRHTDEPKPNQKKGYVGRRYPGIRLKDPGTPVNCQICGKSISSVYLLKTHLQTHIKIKRHKCEYCKLTFTTARNRDRHQQQHESDPENKFRCDICWKRMKTEEELDVHIQVHYSNRPPNYTCDTCGEKFHRKYLMHNHQLSMHTNPEDIEKAEQEIVMKNLLEYAHSDSLNS